MYFSTRNVTEGHLKEIFGCYGTVIETQLNIEYSRNNKSNQVWPVSKLNSALITFASEREAEQALFYLDGGQIDGNVLKVCHMFVSIGHDGIME